MQTFKAARLLEQASKRPYGPHGTQPARASAFIGVSILLNADALATIAMPAGASAFNSVFIWFPNDATQ